MLVHHILYSIIPSTTTKDPNEWCLATALGDTKSKSKIRRYVNYMGCAMRMAMAVTIPYVYPVEYGIVLRWRKKSTSFHIIICHCNLRCIAFIYLVCKTINSTRANIDGEHSKTEISPMSNMATKQPFLPFIQYQYTKYAYITSANVYHTTFGTPTALLYSMQRTSKKKTFRPHAEC